MADGIGDTLRAKAGPLPVWAWAVVGTAGLAGVLYYRQKKTASASQDTTGTSSNLGNVPISNLTTTAQPMPIQMGDTFVNVSQPSTPDPDNPVKVPSPAAGTIKLGTAELTRVTSPTVSRQLMGKGYDIYTIGKTQYYDPHESLTSGHPGTGYTRVSSPAQARLLQLRGFKLTTIGNTQFYDPSQKGVKAA